MLKVLFLLLSIVILASKSTVNSATLKCQYNLWSKEVDDIYFCEVENGEIFNDERVTIDSVVGEHRAGYTNANINGLRFALIFSLKFFPQNLQNIFTDLISIEIYETHLQEIKQDDLKLFPKLKNLVLKANQITTIDANLFEFNTELRSIDLHDNKISHIDPTTFDHLSHLVTLWLSDNKCKNDFDNAYDSRSEVLQVIERVNNGECTNVDYSQAHEEAIKNITLLEAANQECLLKYQISQSDLTKVIDEKAALLKEINELREELVESREKVKMNEESAAELNELREQNEELQRQNEQSKSDVNKMEKTIQELKIINENQAESLRELQRKLIEN